MATPGEFLVNKTANDGLALLATLEDAKTLALRISQGMVAIGVGALSGYEWPNGYTQEKFMALYTALNTLPGLVVEDSVRDKLYEFVAAIQ